MVQGVTGADFDRSIACGNTHLRSILIKYALAAARKMLQAIYCMLKHGMRYRDPKINQDATMLQSNALRCLRMLRQSLSPALKLTNEHT